MGGEGGERVPPEVVQFLTTEHFTLQSQRAAATAEASSRLQLYVGALSSAIVALALVVQATGIGRAFQGFALVLLPVVYLLGLATLGRLGQLWVDWFRAGQGMGRIRHFFLELAPEVSRYVVMPGTDEPWQVLSGSGIGRPERHSWWHGFVTAQAVVGTINSVVAGVVAGVAASALTDASAVSIAFGAGGFLASATAISFAGNRGFFQRMRDATVAFPEEPHRPEQAAADEA